MGAAAGSVSRGRLRGRSALVTGAASGIGAALARRLAREGARLALADRDAEGARALAEALRAEGCEAIALACDVTSPEACRDAVAAACDAFGGLDILVNNAGITQLGRFADTRLDVIRRVLEVNFFGALHCTQAALPRLLERRGLVVVMGSVAGQAPLATRSGYAASKHALHGFFGSLRAEHLGDGLGVLLVDPAFVDTRIGLHALGPDGTPAAADARTGVRGAIAPEVVADAVTRAIVRRRRHCYVPARAGALVWLSRLAPALYERLMARRVAK
jgi:NAD(P)-dependent dehydrogenase (short-subunit alcohol dehydrogenase family)